MDIVVCLKQVPHPEYFSQITIDPVTKRVVREGIPLIINPVDRNAVELGLHIRERFSGKMTVLTMCPPQARESLEEALAMGADEAILLCDRAFAGADTFATAYTLATAISKFCPYDLILCGNETVDSGTSQVGPQLAEFLDIPHVSNAKAVDFIGDKILLVERLWRNGYMKVKVNLPALITVTKKINQPRLPTVAGIMAVASKELKIYGLNDLGLSSEQVGLAGSPTKMHEFFPSKQERRGEILHGEPGQVARDAVEKLRELHVI